MLHGRGARRWPRVEGDRDGRDDEVMAAEQSVPRLSGAEFESTAQLVDRGAEEAPYGNAPIDRAKYRCAPDAGASDNGASQCVPCS
jgi:hypothetical protein